MKVKLFITVYFTVFSLQAQDSMFQPALYPLQLGTIKPKGWIRQQMQHDVKGFVGKLPALVSSLFEEDIYGTEQLQKHSKVKDLGNIKDGNAEGDDQYKWWNSETQSNWWDGYIRQVYAINDSLGKQKVKQYVASMLQKQDSSGYLGIYQPDLRYQFNGENGELWAKTTLYRALLAYYSLEKDSEVLKAVIKAVDNVMKYYPINASSPFSSGNQFNGGVSHGLTFTDVLYQLYLITQNEQYLRYAYFLYSDFSSTYQSEKDVQLASIFNANYRLQSHGVHCFEHIRPLALTALYSKNDSLSKALSIYLNRIQQVTTVTGGAIGDEWIAGRNAHETNTGYEYCSLQELMDSYALLYQLTGNTIYADKMELIFFNAAQGARHPKKSAIAYLKTDNSFKMTGTKNGEAEHDNKQQTRYKYSAAHQDVAVC
ncbi:MAG: beta-L-arabinofuranosidase domain-containing protein, partial [Chitinophagaceae bacterium]